MNENTPVYLKKGFAKRIQDHLERDAKVSFGDDKRRHLSGIIYDAVLTSDWEPDDAYTKLPYKATAELHSDELNEDYISSEAVQIDIYCESEMGGNHTKVVAAYCGVWVALCELSSFEVCVYDESGGNNAGDNVLLPLDGFESAERVFLDEKFEKEDGQWFVSDGETAAAPLPYLKRDEKSVFFAVAVDSGWDWEELRTEFVLKWPEENHGVVVFDAILVEGSSSGGIEVVDDVRLVSGSGSGDSLASSKPIKSSVNILVPDGEETVVAHSEITYLPAVTGVSLSYTSSDSGIDQSFVTEARLVIGPSTSEDSTDFEILIPTGDPLINVEKIEVMRTPETLGWDSGDSGSGDSGSGSESVESVTLVKSLEISNVAGTTWSPTTEVEFVSRVYCEDNQIVYETKKLRVKTGVLTLIPGEKVEVVQSAEPQFEPRALSLEAPTELLDLPEIALEQTTGSFVSYVVNSTVELEKYRPSSVEVVTDLQEASLEDLGIEIDRKSLSIQCFTDPAERIRCYTHDQVNGGSGSGG